MTTAGAGSFDADDVQGNVIPGFNTDIQQFLGFTVTGEFPAALMWIASLAGRVTTAAMVRADRSATADPTTTATDAPWLSISVAARVLRAARPAVVFTDQLFGAGLAATSHGLGDTVAPGLWVVGSPAAPLDVLVVLAANREGVTEPVAVSLKEEAMPAGLTCAYDETGRRLPDNVEHFGFRDGISQPSIAGWDPDGTLGLGNVVFGYARVPDGPVVRGTATDDGAELLANGSLLAFRRLRQDVDPFRQFCAGQATGPVDAAKVAALVVGRWPSGAPVDAAHADADPGVGDQPPANDFAFDNDSTGAICPLAAHIRKVNPRDGKRDVADVPRLVRRGIPFGAPSGPEDRGLLFLGYQTSIFDQSAFLQSSWMNDADRPAGIGSGTDMLVGQGAARTMKATVQGESITITAGSNAWVQETGGGYLLTPGLAGLQALATGSA